jgi:hypothetical protein
MKKYFWKNSKKIKYENLTTVKKCKDLITIKKCRYCNSYIENYTHEKLCINCKKISNDLYKIKITPVEYIHISDSHFLV